MTNSTRIAGALMGVVMGLVPASAALADQGGWDHNRFIVPRRVVPQVVVPRVVVPQQQLQITQQEQQQINNNFNCQVLGNNSFAFCNFRAFSVNSAANAVNANANPARIRFDNRGHGNNHGWDSWGNW